MNDDTTPGDVAAPPLSGGAVSAEKIKVVSIRSRFDAKPVYHLAGDLRLLVGDQVVVRQDILAEEVTLALESGERMVVGADGLTRMPNGQYALKNPIGGE
jgi:hypothetical protein